MQCDTIHIRKNIVAGKLVYGLGGNKEFWKKENGDQYQHRFFQTRCPGKSSFRGYGSFAGTKRYGWRYGKGLAGNRRYVFAESAKLLKQVNDTPVLDGSGLKNTLERMAIRYLADAHVIDFNGKNVLLVCAVDRFGMAEALAEQNCRLLFGDIIYGLGCNIPIRSLAALRRWASVLVPIITRLPIKWMYPTGKKQDSHISRHPEYFADSDVIAGDFLFIKRFMPARLSGKTIITNTVTAADRQMLQDAGVKTLITTTPCLQGRSFGTNVLEAAIVAASGSKKALQPEEYEVFIRKYKIMPSIEHFQ